MPATAAYIHVPFCTHRCGYCNFTLISGRPDLVTPYLDAIEQQFRAAGVRPVQTLFCGGGTPTYLTGTSLQRLLELCQEWHPLAKTGEWSVEANPNDVTAELVQQLQQAGVTRLSLGAQSFSTRKLSLLEREHDANQIQRAVQLSLAAGLVTSIDLIFGVPGETLFEWQADLQQAIALGVQHVSTYGLTWERGTTFWNRQAHGELQRIDEELERAMYASAMEILPAAGIEQYEISNFAQPGFECRHNQAYWQGAEYYATGPGAARYVAGVRSADHRSTTTWIKRVLHDESTIVEEERLAPLERAKEVLVFALRQIAGVDPAWFQATTQHTLNDLLAARGTRLIEQGLLEWRAGRLALTQQGIFVADAICSELLR